MGLYRTGQFLPTYVGRIERAIARTTPARVFQAEFARSFYRTAERRTRLLGQARLVAIDLYSFRRDAMEYALQASPTPTSADVEELMNVSITIGDHARKIEQQKNQALASAPAC